MRLPPALDATLALVADAAAEAAGPWWIVGSAAVALHGAEVPDLRDVDLLMSAADARTLLARLGLPAAPGAPSPLFRSEVFGTWREPPLPVEVMGGFTLAAPSGWEPVAFATREPVRLAARTLYVPSAAELRALLLRLARPKDLARAKLLPR
jgi:hypothetical protein